MSAVWLDVSNSASNQPEFTAEKPTIYQELVRSTIQWLKKTHLQYINTTLHPKCLFYLETAPALYRFNTMMV